MNTIIKEAAEIKEMLYEKVRTSPEASRAAKELWARFLAAVEIEERRKGNGGVR